MIPALFGGWAPLANDGLPSYKSMSIEVLLSPPKTCLPVL